MGAASSLRRRIDVTDAELELERIAILVESRELTEAHERLHLMAHEQSAHQNHRDRLVAHRARIRAYRAAVRREPPDE